MHSLNVCRCSSKIEILSHPLLTEEVLGFSSRCRTQDWRAPPLAELLTELACAARACILEDTASCLQRMFCSLRLTVLGTCRCSNIRSWKDSDRWLAAAQGLMLSAEQKQNFMGYRLTCLDTLKK